MFVWQLRFTNNFWKKKKQMGNKSVRKLHLKLKTLVLAPFLKIFGDS